MDVVLVSWGCHNKVPEIYGFKNRNLFPHISGGWISEIEVYACLVPSEASLLELWITSFPCIFTWSSLSVCVCVLSPLLIRLSVILD